MAADNKRVIDLIEDVEEKRIVMRPFFQRRLVWTATNKEFFIDTVLKNYPFPEIFVATGGMDLQQRKRKIWLVDGQQRVTTLLEYVQGTSKDWLYRKIPRYSDLTEKEQSDFMHYQVAVRDLGEKSDEEIREIFRRINSTDFALNSMEKLNAMFSGAYKSFCETLAKHPFFLSHKVFSRAVEKRMDDVTFCVILVTTLLSGYYRRVERNEEYLERYNDDFPDQGRMQSELDAIFEFLEQCGFESTSRAWKRTNLFTLIVELRAALFAEKLSLNPEDVGRTLGDFFRQVDEMYSGKTLPEEAAVPAGQQQVFRYLKAATKASDDKYARIQRAEIVAGLIRCTLEATTEKASRKPAKRSKR